ncbi:hypothetical protein N6H14_10340 [Paenibacillus sp. CC-CFT747]|nr:hypothetical protein N6H14_10340 [Paenibacillus sp. CC-CFT747]
MLPILSAAGLASMNQLTNAKNQLNSISDYFTDPVNWTNWAGGIIKVLVIWIVGRIIIKIAQKAITHMMVERERSPLRFDPAGPGQSDGS